MVAHLLSLKLLLLRNTLRRHIWQLIAVILGALYAVAMLALVVVGLVLLGSAPTEVIHAVLVLAGSLLVLGWLVIPVLATGLDQTLDPSRLAVYPLSSRTMLLGLAGAALLGVPGLLTLLASVATAAAWWRTPVAAAVAVPAALLAVAICIVGSRAASVLGSALAGGRRAREASGILILIPLILLGPIIILVTSGLQNLETMLPTIARALSWSPFGAPWALPGDVLAGDWIAVAAKTLIAAGSLVALVLLWRAGLRSALENPRHRSAKMVARGRIGAFGRFPATPWGAVAARSLTYWFRDPRYLRNLLVVPLIPLLLAFYSSIEGAPPLVHVSGPAVAVLLAMSIYADISYDGTAFTMTAASGVSGAADRTGRAVALGSWGLPAVLLITVGSVWYTGDWPSLPGLLGMTAGLFLSGLALASVSSAMLIVPVPAPDAGPFSRPQGANFTIALATFAWWGILALLAVPEIVLAVLSFVYRSALFGWLAAIVGVVLGVVLLVIGIRVGGARLDRNAPDLLLRLRRAG